MHRRWWSSLLLAVVLVFAGTATAQAATPIAVGNLRTADLVEPLGVSDPTPTLSWRLSASTANQVQSAYQLQAASSSAALLAGRADRWDTGKVSSAATSVAWGGSALTSKAGVWWRVQSWNAQGVSSGWSTPGSFEMGLLAASDWAGKWIGASAPATPVSITVPAQDARIVRLDVTKLGAAIQEGFPNPVSRLQLSEIAVVDSAAPGTNLAQGATVTASESDNVANTWSPAFATDGITISQQNPRGYTSKAHGEQALSAPITVALDLGATKRFDRVLLYPRTDVTTSANTVAGFPVDYTVKTAPAAGGTFTTGATVTGQAAPAAYKPATTALPLFAKQFDLPKAVSSARLRVVGLGVYTATLNGAPVTDAVLEPPNTAYKQRVEYATYDVTKQVKQGANAVGVALGNGMYNVGNDPGRYKKLSRSDGPLKMLAQLDITYSDGTTAVVGSDPTWRTSTGPTTTSSWFGGEDYDARLAKAGWDRPGTDLSSWATAVASTPPGENTLLVGRAAPPIKPVQTIKAVKITSPSSGVYVADLGVNIAGWQQLTLDLPAGTTVTMRPSELLNGNGTVNQSTTGSPIFDRYTSAGGGSTTWHPQFAYHGFRYLQIEGLPAAPTTDQVSGVVLRAANESSGSFTSSNQLINQIHGIIDRAIQGNMYSVLTDCPHREKLGWLEETHLVMGAVTRNYDVPAYYRDIVRNVAEAQTGSGLVPDIAPEYTLFSGPFRDEPNWGGALVLVPLQLLQLYGDKETAGTYYPNMVRYVDYLGTRASGNLLDGGLGDWRTTDNSTPLGVTASFAYHRIAAGMAQVATALGKTADAQKYATLATNIGSAFNAKYFDAAGNTYASGSQASDALALDMGIVPADKRQAVVDHLVASVTKANFHTTTGEIALPSFFRVLSAAGRDDLIYQIATRTDHPSYGYQVVNGATALTEDWDGPTRGNSQNHFMLGAIDEWFSSGLAGIRQAAGSEGYAKIVVRPAVVGDLGSATGKYRSPQGEISSAWTRSGNAVTMTVTVPANTASEIWVPVAKGAAASTATSTAGLTPTRTEAGTTYDYAVFPAGSGTYTLRGAVA